MIPDAWRPRTKAICLATIEQIHVIIINQFVISIANNFPVYKVVRFHDGNSGIHMHGSTGHVIGISNAGNSQVGDISKNQWIGKRGLITPGCKSEVTTTERYNQ